MSGDRVGTLFVVATPIGNREDITLRALRVLREADLVACEDTRRTGLLLKHFGLRKPLVSYHDFNERQRADFLRRALAEGQQVALVTDAGTPAISDPGYRLLAACAEAGLPVVPVPGPSALAAALSVSHVPVDRFYFAGFPPPRAGPRRGFLGRLSGLDAAVVFFEAPHRLKALLDDLLASFGDREAVLGRELTKLHEEILRGPLSRIREAIAGRGAVKGEVTLIVAAAHPGAGAAEAGGPAVPGAVPADLPAEYEALRCQGLPRPEILARLARRHGLRRNEVYRRLTEEGGPRRNGAGGD